MILDYKSLPPLDYLIAFECAALLGGFAHAARHLNVSQSAISRKIKLLEQHYQAPLFERHNRSVVLTEYGQALLPTVREAFDLLREKSDFLIGQRPKATVTIAATHSVASLWLSPRLAQFQARHEDITIMLTATDSDERCLQGDVDYSILRGEGQWPGFESCLLFGETVFPVCSPSYLEAHKNTLSLECILQHNLIEIKNHHFEWMTWADWLAKQGAMSAQIHKTSGFNTYPLAIQAAIGGLGLVLGWGHLVDSYLESGQLIRPFGNRAVRTTSGYYLLRAEKEAPKYAQKAVENWLLAEGAKRKRYATFTDQGN